MRVRVPSSAPVFRAGIAQWMESVGLRSQRPLVRVQLPAPSVYAVVAQWKSSGVRNRRSWVQVLPAAQEACPYRLVGPGRHPFTVKTGVRLPVGTPSHGHPGARRCCPVKRSSSLQTNRFDSGSCRRQQSGLLPGVLLYYGALAQRKSRPLSRVRSSVRTRYASPRFTPRWRSDEYA